MPLLGKQCMANGSINFRQLYLLVVVGHTGTYIVSDILVILLQYLCNNNADNNLFIQVQVSSLP